MTVIDEGIQIDCSDEQPLKALLPRTVILQPDSNANVDRFLQREKHKGGIVSIDEGMYID
jgi:hypothetical protein